MANYTIIGGDKKEYGPVTAEDIRQWVAEGRLDRNSQARSENDTEWRQLAAFPEFAPLFQSRQSPPPLNAMSRSSSVDALVEVKVPAICLIVTAILNILMALWDLADALFFPKKAGDALADLTSTMESINPAFQKSLNDPQMQSLFHALFSPGAMIANFAFALAMSVLVLLGALRMKALRNYEFAFVAAILAIVPCLTTCCFLGLPFGIWALIVLRRPGIKDQFN